jgi:hypothetical protein
MKFVALLFVLSFASACIIQPAGPDVDCHYMRNRNTGEFDCFGCVDGICRFPTGEWIMVEENSDMCQATNRGCVL